MKIVMKYSRHYYENCNEISQALLWELQWHIPSIIMRIVMKYPGNIMKMVMKYSRHYYENCNEISQAFFYENCNEIPSWYYENHNEILLWELQWIIPSIIMIIAMKHPKDYYENHNEIPRQYYENGNIIFQALLWELQ